MAKAIYNGVDNVARKVKQSYVGVSNVARKVKSGYIGVDNVARECFSSGATWKKYDCIQQNAYYYNHQIESPSTYGGGAPDTHSSYSFDVCSDYSWNSYTGYTTSGREQIVIPLDDYENLNLDEYTTLIAGKYSTTYSDTAEILEYISIDRVYLETLVNGMKYIMFDFTARKHTLDVSYDYYQGSTFYGTITAPENELPEEGTLVEGSLEEGYFVLQVGSNYYYYILEV